MEASLTNERARKAQKLELVNQKVRYVKVQADHTGSIIILPMDAYNAQLELQNLNHQAHTISRLIAKNCQ